MFAIFASLALAAPVANNASPGDDASATPGCSADHFYVVVAQLERATALQPEVAGGQCVSESTTSSDPSKDDSLTVFDGTWAEHVENMAWCDHDAANTSSISCERHTQDDSIIRVIRLAPGVFDLYEQVWIPECTIIVGNSNPNVLNPSHSVQTYLKATNTLKHPAYTNVFEPYCEHSAGATSATAKKWRKGFLLNSQTAVLDINLQGADTVRPGSGNLCGGGAFELPGCMGCYGGGSFDAPTCWDTPNAATMDKNATWQRKVDPSVSVTGLDDGRGVRNAVVASVRVNDYFHGQTENRPATQTLFWSAMTPDTSPHANIRLTNVHSAWSIADGINVHGNVKNFTADNVVVMRSGDDALAIWGAGGGDNAVQWPASPQACPAMTTPKPQDITFRNIFVQDPGFKSWRNFSLAGHQVGPTTWGTCIALFGTGKAMFENVTCCDRNDSEILAGRPSPLGWDKGDKTRMVAHDMRLGWRDDLNHEGAFLDLGRHCCVGDDSYSSDEPIALTNVVWKSAFDNRSIADHFVRLNESYLEQYGEKMPKGVQELQWAREKVRFNACGLKNTGRVVLDGMELNDTICHRPGSGPPTDLIFV